MQQRRGQLLTVAGYELTGGIHAAVARSAERAYTRLSPQAKDIARQVLLRMVRVEPDVGAATRRAVTWAELSHLPQDKVREVIDGFVAARLVVAAEHHVEIIHEALLTAWPRLHGWVEADRVGLCIRQRLSEAAQQWHQAQHPKSLLYQGMPLSAASEWAEVRTAELTSAEREFLITTGREQRRGRRRLRLLVALLTVLLLLAGLATGVALWQRGLVRQERDTAVSQRIAERASAVRATNPSLAMQLSVAAFRTAPTLEARSAVLSTAVPYATRLQAGAGWIRGLTFNPSGRILAAVPTEDVITLWDTTTLSAVGSIPSHAGKTCCAVFSPVSDVLLVSGGHGTDLWDVSAPANPARLGSLGASVEAATPLYRG